MMATLKAEFRKLITVRTTYGLIAIGLLFAGLFSFFAGYKASAASLMNPNLISENMLTALSLSAFASAIVAILLLANEYRHNTIMYTLTASNSRSKVLVAKMLIVLGFAALYTVFIAAASVLINRIGLQVSGHELVPQVIHYGQIWWRVLFFGCGYAMIGLLFITLMRNQIISIIGLFVIPASLEGVLSLLLKEKSMYLPFSALGEVLTAPAQGSISYAKAAGVFMIYLVVGWIVAWTLFVKRDAN